MTEEDSSALKVLADCTIDLPSSRFRLPVVAMNESKFSATMTMAPQFADTCKKIQWHGTCFGQDNCDYLHNKLDK